MLKINSCNLVPRFLSYPPYGARRSERLVRVKFVRVFKLEVSTYQRSSAQGPELRSCV